MRQILVGAVTAMIVTCYGSAAFAGPTCTDEAKEKWLSEAEMQAKITASGTTIEVFKTTKGNCYEIYGRNADGERVEVYYHPVTGAVEKEVKI